MIVLIIINIILIVLGVIILIGKGDFLIAGYNTSSKKERDKVNVKRLRYVIAGLLFVIPIIISMPFLIGEEDNVMVVLASPFLAIIVTIVCLILANTWCLKK